LKKNKSGILAQVLDFRLARPGHFWAGVGVFGISLFGMVAAFGTARDTRFIDIPRLETVEHLALPALVPAAETEQSFLREERVQRGDTVMDLLQRLGIDDPAAVSFLKGNATSQTLFRQLSPGKNLTARTGPQGELQALVFPLNGGKDQALVVEGRTAAFPPRSSLCSWKPRW
jgi:hypothetical protein